MDQPLTPRANCILCSVVCSFAAPWIVTHQAPLSMGSPRRRNTGVGCLFLLQGIFQNQGSNPPLPCLLPCQEESLPLSHLGSLCWANYSPLKVAIFPRREQGRASRRMSQGGNAPLAPHPHPEPHTTRGISPSILITELSASLPGASGQRYQDYSHRTRMDVERPAGAFS